MCARGQRGSRRRGGKNSAGWAGRRSRISAGAGFRRDGASDVSGWRGRLGRRRNGSTSRRCRTRTRGCGRCGRRGRRGGRRMLQAEQAVGARFDAELRLGERMTPHKANEACVMILDVLDRQHLRAVTQLAHASSANEITRTSRQYLSHCGHLKPNSRM